MKPAPMHIRSADLWRRLRAKTLSPKSLQPFGTCQLLTRPLHTFAACSCKHAMFQVAV